VRLPVAFHEFEASLACCLVSAARASRPSRSPVIAKETEEFVAESEEDVGILSDLLGASGILEVRIVLYNYQKAFGFS
jgi:hypothetical protein